MKKNKNSGLPPLDLLSEVTNLFRQFQKRSFNHKEISSRLGLGNKALREKIEAIIKELLSQDVIEITKNDKYILKSTSSFVDGKIDITSKGYGFVTADGFEKDIFVPAHKIGKALPGDTVKVLLRAVRKNGKTEGEVIEVLERSKLSFVGIIEISTRFAFLIADSKEMPVDIFVSQSDLNGAINGQKVIVKIIEWPEKSKNPIGVVTEILGTVGENETEMRSIITEFGFKIRFPEEAIAEAEKLSDIIPQEEIDKRLDLRGTTTFTIDPVDAKDFDDALSIKKLSEKVYEIGIHIADVSHYVKPKTALDEEALKRSTSVYLVDRVVPMLPENISNVLCSLRPNEDKLTFSAIFEIDVDGNVLKRWFGRTIIHSDRRFSYEEAQEIIDAGEGDFIDELKILNDISKQIRIKRFENGSLRFESREFRFKLDENAKPIGIVQKERKDTHLLVEDFMLLANKEVASFVFKLKKGIYANHFVYRVHDVPDQEKLQLFANYAARFGYNLKVNNRAAVVKSLNELYDKIAGNPEQEVLESMGIRSMAKAEYTTKNIGHYGLAFDYYTHFTSPIRRYPDVLAHRLLQLYLDNQAPASIETLEQECRHSSEQERKAAKAERASVKFKQIEMIADRIDQDFEGIITEIKDFGIYVEILENYCEGLVKLQQMEDDRYYFDEDEYAIIGVSHNRVFKLGQKVIVKLLKVNLQTRTVDLKILPEAE